ncbi:MAG: T9SS type A sorting domain-containing protein [Bacteroidia bacterium]|nr:T9SS type A sorting domain-containing protein [Bacteroidia bacterium]
MRDVRLYAAVEQSGGWVKKTAQLIVLSTVLLGWTQPDELDPRLERADSFLKWAFVHFPFSDQNLPSFSLVGEERIRYFTPPSDSFWIEKLRELLGPEYTPPAFRWLVTCFVPPGSNVPIIFTADCYNRECVGVLKRACIELGGDPMVLRRNGGSETPVSHVNLEAALEAFPGEAPGFRLVLEKKGERWLMRSIRWSGPFPSAHQLRTGQGTLLWERDNLRELQSILSAVSEGEYEVTVIRRLPPQRKAAPSQPSSQREVIRLQPNPTGGEIAVTILQKNALPAQVSLYDSQGRVVGEYTVRKSPVTIPISGPVGVYFVTVRLSGGEVIREVVWKH